MCMLRIDTVFAVSFHCQHSVFVNHPRNIFVTAACNIFYFDKIHYMRCNPVLLGFLLCYVLCCVWLLLGHDLVHRGLFFAGGCLLCGVWDFLGGCLLRWDGIFSRCCFFDCCFFDYCIFYCCSFNYCIFDCCPFDCRFFDCCFFCCCFFYNYIFCCCFFCFYIFYCHFFCQTGQLLRCVRCIVCDRLFRFLCQFRRLQCRFSCCCFLYFSNRL